MLGTKIKDYMVATPQTIGEDITLTKAMEMMRERQIRHLPVQFGGELVGVLSDRDIKLALALHPAAQGLKTGDIMTEEPYSVSSETPIADVLSQMAIHKYGCAIVKNGKGSVCGIFTATDAVRVLSEVFAEKEQGAAGWFCETRPGRIVGRL
ncbi:MAG: CBS domain-containing protein [Deltaproteobacteria bacterium]|nr:CBS domain-containing protein [Deltaproteobacteria bacterium]MBI3294246.1 CBS domain-containing protein [Deltaproteobacteria bacterium]